MGVVSAVHPVAGLEVGGASDGSIRKGLSSKEKVKSGDETNLNPDADALDFMVDGWYHCPYAVIHPCPPAVVVAKIVSLRAAHTGWLCVTAGRSVSASLVSRQRYIPI